MGLAAERPAPGGRTESVWYAAHEERGTIAAYLAGVRAAWDDARRRYPADDPRSFARQASYALLVGSVTSTEALPATTSVDRPYDWARVLCGLAPYLSGGLLDQALAAAVAIEQPDARAEALSGLAPYLSDDQRDAVFAEALAAAAAIRWPDARERALTAMASHLPEDQRGPVLAQTLTAATAISRPDVRERALNHRSGGSRSGPAGGVRRSGSRLTPTSPCASPSRGANLRIRLRSRGHTPTM